MVEMDRIRVLGEQREPDVIRGNDGAAQGMRIDVANLEILVDPSGPSFLACHSHLLTSRVRFAEPGLLERSSRQITPRARHLEMVAESNPSSPSMSSVC